jgi:membrane-associated phospholipid phosphatase
MTTRLRSTKASRTVAAIQKKDFLWCFAPLALWALCWLFLPEPGLFLYINHSARILPDIVWVAFNMLGNGWSVFALCSPLLVFAPRLLTSAILGGAIAGALSRLPKHVLEMPRPAGILDHASFYILERPLTSFAMPSGHTLTAFAVLSGIYFAIDRRHRGTFFWLFILATLGGLARIAVGAHWPSDVFAGASLGIFGGILGGHFSNRIPDALFESTSWLLRAIGVGAGLCAYMLITTKIDFKLAQPVQYIFAIIAITSVLSFFWRSFRFAKSHK